MYVVRYSEIGLKGKNRISFEKKLIENIKWCLDKNSIKHKIKRLRNRILIYSEQDCSCLKNIFGISSISKAVEIKADLDDIKKESLNLVFKEKSFRVSCQRLDKILKTSREINKEVGAYIVEKKRLKVDLKNYELNIGIELIKDKAYLFKEKIRGLDGLPVGIEGEVCVLLENKDSLKSAYLMMKRGCSIKLTGKKINFDSLKKYSEINFVENCEFDVVNDTLDSIREGSYFRPLIGYKEKEIKV